ncbi:MAG: hypothetical protein WAM04_16860 [Candidatus Sulfotelmatobacter sp.]
MSKPSFVIVIVEDERHEMLVRRYLRKYGMGPHQVTYVRSPSGAGSAEQWVRSRFAKEVSAYRNRRARAATALIVVIDADAHTVQGRLTQLSGELKQSGIQAITSGEQVARLVPKRNVETWILCLHQEPVDEETDYKGRRDDWNELIPQAAATLFQWTRAKAELPNHCVASLRTGIKELNRLTF